MSESDGTENDLTAKKETAAAEAEALQPTGAHILRDVFNLKKQNVHSGHRARMRQSAKNDADLNALSDVELVEILLSFFIPQKDTNVLAHKLLDRFGSVAGVLCAKPDELNSFPNVTAKAAAMLPRLFKLCLTQNGKTLRLKDRAEIADFFGLANLGKLDNGTYVMFFDSRLNVRGLECFECDGVPLRDILGSACKKRCKYLFVARREPDLFPPLFNIAAEIGRLSEMLSDMNIVMLDFIIFSDYGYYTVGAPPRKAGWHPMYIFVPAVKQLNAHDLYGAITSSGVYAGRETAEKMDDFAMQLCAAIKVN